MKMKKSLKRILMGCLGFLMAAVLFMSSTLQGFRDVIASPPNVFDQITSKYGGDDGRLKIIEVIPDETKVSFPEGPAGPPIEYANGKYTFASNIHAKAELGYFLWRGESWDNNNQYWKPVNQGTIKNPSMATWGTSLSKVAPNNSATVTATDTSYTDLLVQMYRYGVIQQTGADPGMTRPIIGRGKDPDSGMRPYLTIFQDYPSGSYTALGDSTSIVLGVYEELKDDTGKPKTGGRYAWKTSYAEDTEYTEADNTVYKLKGYSINDNGQICYQRVYDTTISANAAISMNDAGAPQVGDSAPDPQNSGNSYHYISKEVDGDTVRYTIALDAATAGMLALPSMLQDKGADSTEGTVTFKRTETATTDKTQYYGFSDRGLYYLSSDTVCYQGSDLFSQYVLGKESRSGSTTNVKNNMPLYETVTSSELTPDMVDKANLIYISGKADDFAKKDIRTDAMIALYNKEVNEHKAVMMDYACYSPSLNTNVSRLALLLWQEKSQSTIQENYSSLFNIDLATQEGKLKDQTGTLFSFGSKEDDIIDELKDSMLQGGDGKGNGNFVVGNVYVYNHHVNDYENPASIYDAYDSIANGDFNSSYTQAVQEAGFLDVMNYIATYNKVASAEMNPSVTPAIAIQYILISDGNGLTVMKEELTVLEIQPVTSFLYNEQSGSEEYAHVKNAIKKNRRDFINDYLSDFYSGKQDYIRFVSKTVDEFNGSNEDLIETYDIIFIGSEMGDKYFTNTKTIDDAEESYPTRKWTDDGGYAQTFDDNYKEPLSIFNNDTVVSGTNAAKNDLKMTGNVYYVMGDIFQNNGAGKTDGWSGSGPGGVNNRLWAIHFLDYFEKNPNSEQRMISRFSSRDITKNKLQKLEEYLDADNLIICEKDLMSQVYNGTKQINPTSKYFDDNAPEKIEKDGKLVDCGRIDNSSNMFELFKYALGYEFCYDINKTETYKDTNGVEHTKKLYGTYIPMTDAASSTAQSFEKPNFVSAGDLICKKTSKSEFEKYVATDKITLTLNRAPEEYSYSTYEATVTESGVKHYKGSIKDSTYLKVEDDGTRSLVYDFVISSKSSVMDLYRPYLFVDINNDGKYSKETEMITDSQVFVKSTNQEAPLDPTGTYYELSRDVEYELRRPIDNNYYGFIKWKLYIQSVSDVKVHASAEGNTVAKNLGSDVNLNILQLNINNDEHLNLQNELEKSNGDADSRTFVRYLDHVPGYNLIIKTQTVSQFETDFADKYIAAVNTALASSKPVPTQEQYSETYFDSMEFSRTINGSEYKQKGCGMMVCGFGDNYSNFGTQTRTASNGTEYTISAINAVRRYMENGNPVLLTHDFIMFDGSYDQIWHLRDLVGMDKFGNTLDITADGSKYNKMLNVPNTLKYLHSGEVINRDTSTTNNDGKMAAIESTGKQPAYSPGTLRSRVERYTQGFTDSTFFRYKWSDWNSKHHWHAWLNTPDVYVSSTQGEYGYQSDFSVDQLNSGQITCYPYSIPTHYDVSKTHFQYFELDMDADDDNDGESDVVVWYTLGDSRNNAGHNEFGTNADFKHASTAYYIYNKGNITYTGAGHASLYSAPDAEAMLFVNTLFAALQSKLVKPSAGFYETSSITASPVSSVAVPYDKNVTKDETVDSSILKDTNGAYKYKFVDPNHNGSQDNGTKIYFRMEDANFTRGTKSMEARLYLALPSMKDGENFTLPNGRNVTVETRNVDGEAVPCVDVTEYIKVYNVNSGNFTTPIGLIDREVTDSANNTTSVKVLTGMKSQVTYGFYLPMSYLSGNANFTMILESSSMITTQSAITGEESGKEQTDAGFTALTVTKAELLDLD